MYNPTTGVPHHRQTGGTFQGKIDGETGLALLPELAKRTTFELHQQRIFGSFLPLLADAAETRSVQVRFLCVLFDPMVETRQEKRKNALRPIA